MAKRKHHKRTHRRKRMGAIGTGMLAQIGGVAAGAVAAQFLKKFLPDSVNPKLKAGIQVAAGVVFPKLVKGNFGQNMGAGMIAAGAVNLATEFNIGGVGEDQLLLPVSVGAADTDSVSVIAGQDEFAMAGMDADSVSVIAGMDEEDY